MNKPFVELHVEIDRLEKLTSAVLDALTQAKTAEVQQLVIEQCACMQRIGNAQVPEEQAPRMRRIAEMVELQQELIKQVLQTAEHFLKSSHIGRSYNQFA